jgi:hypothetical protein
MYFMSQSVINECYSFLEIYCFFAAIVGFELYLLLKIDMFYILYMVCVKTM